MSSAQIKEKIIRYFSQPPPLQSAFYFSSGYLSGIHVSPREKNLRGYFFSPIESGAIDPSFTKMNILNRALLEERLQDGLEKLHLHDKNTACIIPDLSVKTFVLSFESLPSSSEAREKIARFRIIRQMGLLPEDTRLSFHQIGSDSAQKLFVTLARTAIIEEYEDLLSRIGLSARAVSSPLIGLFKALNRREEENWLLINIEKKSLSLLAVVNSEITLYRQKPLALKRNISLSSPGEMKNIINEVENTVHFIEDREKKKVDSFYIRLGLPSGEEEVFSQLQEKCPFSLKRADVSLAKNLNLKEREILSPLIGQLL